MRRLVLLLSAIFAVLGATAASGQSGINCETADGRKLYVPGAKTCPFGLTPSAAPQAAPMPPQKAAFLARGPQEIAAVQQALIKLDFLKGDADGAYGPGTDAAIRAWQKSKSLPETGYLVDEQLAALQHDLEPPLEEPKLAQEFRCPERGMLFTYATISEPITVAGERVSLGSDGLSCFYFVRAQADANYADSQYFAGFWRALTPGEQEFLLKLGPGELWPLKVGKSVERDVQSGDATTHLRLSVDRYEAIDTPVGRLPAYVVTVVGRTGAAAKEKVERTFWWSPQLGEALRFIERDGAGTVTMGWQVVSVTH